MARAKISQLDPKGADLSSTDLFEVSVNTGSGYDTYSITGQEIINGGSGVYVPYTGATQDVDLDANKLSAESIYIEGTNGAGHLHLKHQNADATATGQSTALFADVNGDIKYKNDNDYYTTLKTSLNTADRVYTFPNTDCTLVPNGAITTSGLTMATSRLLGRTTASNGAVEEISIGTGLTLSGGTLSSTGGGITIGTTAITSGTVGRILFEGTGNVVQEDSALFWDNTNKRLGIGATPSTSVPLDVRSQGTLSTDVGFRVRNSADTANLFDVQGNGFVNVRTRMLCGFSGMTTTGGALHVYAGNNNDFVARFFGTTGVSFLNIRTAGNGCQMELLDASGTAGVTLNGIYSNAITLADSRNIVFGTGGGTKIASTTTQKFAFWGKTPIVQPTTAVAAATFVANTSLIVNDTATFDGYTIGQVVKALRNLGILA